MYIADLHIHSRYSRATSHDCTPEALELWARKKGIQLLGTGDFTHPSWREELKEKLVPAEEGLYTLKEEYRIHDNSTDDSQAVRFVVTGEISSIYKQGERVRKVHSLLLLPNLETAELLSARLEQIGNIHSDGRPILGLPCRDLLEIMLEVCPDAVYVPAHIWTPHFSLFGAFSGFDTIEECFGDLTPHIHALETGLSSDPPMNWRLSALDSYQLISNSDAHSPAKLGREANLLDTQLSYPALKKALDTGDGLRGTIEFFPEEGKYHLDGHRKCHLCLSPAETIKYGGKCPVCGKKLTIGVSHRVEELADRAEGYVRPDGKVFESLVPLPEVIAASTGKTAASVKVQRQYQDILSKLGNEFSILREVPQEDIKLAAGTMIAEGISRLRRGSVLRNPGFDGEYGTIRLFEPWELENVDGQISLFLPSRESLAAAPKGAGADSDTDNAVKETAASVELECPQEAGSSDNVENRDNGPAGSSIPNKNSFLAHLNEKQREAAAIPARAIAVTAGPGTGKTGTLTSRIGYLLEERGVKPSEITAVTFTNKAATELRERLEKQVGGKRITRLLSVGTFHGLCLELLKKHGFDRIPAPEEMLLETAADIVREYNLNFSPSGFLRQLSLKKSRMELFDPAGRRTPASTAEGVRSTAATEENSSEVTFHEAAQEYQKRLIAEGACDFDDLLLETLKLLKTEQKNEIRKQRFNYLLVDEFQDVNPVQFELIRVWNRGGRELFVIGDPDQSIYGFRGTDAACFGYLKKEHPSLIHIVLNVNYRSVPAILEGAQAVISENPGPERRLEPVCGEGAKIRLVTAESAMSEAIFIAKEINRLVGGIDMLDAQEKRITGRLTGFSDIAVLYRTHRQAALLEKCLRKEGIPYRVAGRDAFLADPEVRGSISFFRSLLNPEDRFSARLSRRLLWNDLGDGEREERFAREAEHYLPLLKKGKPSDILEHWITAAKADDRGKRRSADKKGIQKSGGEAEGNPNGDTSGSQNMEKLWQLSFMYHNMREFMEALAFGTEGELIRPGKKQYRSDAVTLMSLHASKGLEFPAVILCGVRKGLIPLERQPAGKADETDEEEERRLFYVGMTRAKEQLILVTGKEQSEFLNALPETCLKREEAGKTKRAESGFGQQLSLFDWMKEK
ncbi:UvrD-helicase domain-containing protein [Clostridium transplantifaecale]|uniref:UvrD-helicase domain-containing protein n=1 Tax=Clostridium transplantifaecale TaxID=2479838 RepID=UPI000F63B9C1|nr:UvrD-helicase domain-containing protein [Clostridium transplantifaecale]